MLNLTVTVDPAVLRRARIRRSSRERHRFAAAAAGCDRLVTEDLSDGATFGSLRIENPFV